MNEQKITVIIDETGDRKKGKKTDYVARQYLGSVGKIDNGIVSVNAYGVYENITFPLMFKVFKPKGTLKKSDTYKTKIELASSIVTELIEFGFNIDSVLARKAMLCQSCGAYAPVSAKLTRSLRLCDDELRRRAAFIWRS